MKTNNWREEIRKLIYIRPESLNDAERLYLEAQNIIQSLLDKQKEEIIERIIKAVDDTCYLNEQGSTVIADSDIDRLIKQIKEI